MFVAIGKRRIKIDGRIAENSMPTDDDSALVRLISFFLPLFSGCGGKKREKSVCGGLFALIFSVAFSLFFFF
jgi:hypothetical protein